MIDSDLMLTSVNCVSAEAETGGRRDQRGSEAAVEEAAGWEGFPQRGGGESAPWWLRGTSVLIT